MPSYSPPFAPHVRGDYPEPRRDEDGAVEPVRIALSCARCGDRSETRCDSGRPRRRVALYAVGHAACPERKIDA